MNTKFISGKSRRVFLSEKLAVKRPIYKSFLDKDFKESILFGSYGKFENIKEYFLWVLISNKKYVKNTFANISRYDLLSNVIFQEKLSLISEKCYELFWEKFDFIREKLSLYQERDLYYLFPFDDHTLSNPENFGIDSNGNLKILDFALDIQYVFDLYAIDFKSFDKESYKKLEKQILDDVLISDNSNLSNKIYFDLLPFILALKYYDNWYMFLISLYKQNIITFKDFVNISWEKFKTIF